MKSVEVCTKSAREVFGSLHVQKVLCPGGSKNGWYQKNFVLLKTQTASYLTLSWWRSLSYRIQSIDSQSKSMDWFLYDRDLRHERVRQHLFAISLFSCKRLYLQINPKVSSWVARYSGDCAPDCHTKLCWIAWFEILFENRNVDYKIHHFGETILIIFHHSKQNCHF